MKAENAADLRDETEDFSHTGPGTLAGRFLRRFWQPLFISQDLKPGWSVTVRAMGEDFTLYRGEGGEPHLVAARCAHRGTRLSTGYVEGDDIRCTYHGWKYDAGGQCLEQPSEPRSFAERVRIAAYPVREYLGLIFAWLGEGEPPPMPRYPHYEAGGVVIQTFMQWPFNYFQHLENAIDEAHIGILHARSPYEKISFDVPQISAEETDYGLAQYGTRNNGIKRATHYQMPNMTSWAQPPGYPEEEAWREVLGWRVPVDDHSHYMCLLTHAYVAKDKEQSFLAHRNADWDRLAKLPPVQEVADAVLSGRMRFKDLPFRGQGSDMTRIQDNIVMIGQGTIVDRDNECLGAADAAIVLLRRLWKRELTALRDEQPLKQWSNTIPPARPGV
ncbi:MAG: Rieske (2Fe-2S) protein [Betaproteobacteria bacterium]|nr:Rieske (2Fe-2S) protein [Betaproteobacteria bacterium]